MTDHTKAVANFVVAKVCGMGSGKSFDMEKKMKSSTERDLAKEAFATMGLKVNSSGILGKKHLQQMTDFLGYKQVKGNFRAVASHLLRQLDIPFHSREIASYYLRGGLNRLLLVAFMNEVSNTGQQRLDYDRCSYDTLKACLYALIGEEYRPKSDRSGELRLPFIVLSRMGDLLGLDLAPTQLGGNGKKSELLGKISKELSIEVTQEEIDTDAIQSAQHARRVVIAFIEQADGFIEDATETLSKIELLPRGGQARKRKFASLPAPVEVVIEPPPVVEPLPTEEKKMDIFKLYKSRNLNLILKCLEVLDRVGNVTSCEVVNDTKLKIEVDIG